MTFVEKLVSSFYLVTGNIDVIGKGDIQTQLTDEEIKRILITGSLDGGTKTISEDGKTMTSVIEDGMTLTKSFSDDFLTCASVLRNSSGTIIGEMVKTFSEDGLTIATEFSIT